MPRKQYVLEGLILGSWKEEASSPYALSEHAPLVCLGLSRRAK